MKDTIVLELLLQNFEEEFTSDSTVIDSEQHNIELHFVKVIKLDMSIKTLL